MPEPTDLAAAQELARRLSHSHGLALGELVASSKALAAYVLRLHAEPGPRPISCFFCPLPATTMGDGFAVCEKGRHAEPPCQRPGCLNAEHHDLSAGDHGTADLSHRKRRLTELIEEYGPESGTGWSTPARYALLEETEDSKGTPRRWLSTHAGPVDAEQYHRRNGRPWCYLILVDLDSGKPVPVNLDPPTTVSEAVCFHCGAPIVLMPAVGEWMHRRDDGYLGQTCDLPALTFATPPDEPSAEDQTEADRAQWEMEAERRGWIKSGAKVVVEVHDSDEVNVVEVPAGVVVEVIHCDEDGGREHLSTYTGPIAPKTDTEVAAGAPDRGPSVWTLMEALEASLAAGRQARTAAEALLDQRPGTR